MCCETCTNAKTTHFKAFPRFHVEKRFTYTKPNPHVQYCKLQMLTYSKLATYRKNGVQTIHIAFSEYQTFLIKQDYVLLHILLHI